MPYYDYKCVKCLYEKNTTEYYPDRLKVPCDNCESGYYKRDYNKSNVGFKVNGSNYQNGYS